MKEEEDNAIPNLDILTCLDGFSLVLGSKGDIIYVSKNVTSYMGVKAEDLLGEKLADFIHPCDLLNLASLTSPLAKGEIKRGEATVRMKCTVTERGRLVNLKQATILFFVKLDLLTLNSTGIIQAPLHHWTHPRAWKTSLRIVRGSFHRHCEPHQPPASSAKPAQRFYISPLS